MNTNLPGGKGQSNPVTTTQTQAIGTSRTVRIERLEKMSDLELQSKISRFPEKIKSKTDAMEKRIAKLREKLAAYETFKKAEVSACKKILEDRKKSPTVPNAGQPTQAKAA